MIALRILLRLLRRAARQRQHLRHVRDILLAQRHVLRSGAQVVVLLRQPQPALIATRNLLASRP